MTDPDWCYENPAAAAAAIDELEAERDALARENTEIRLTHEQWKHEYLEDLSKRMQKVLREYL